MATLRTTMKGLGMKKWPIGANLEKDGRNSTPFPALPQGHTEQNCLEKPKKTSHPQGDCGDARRNCGFAEWAPETELFGRGRQKGEKRLGLKRSLILSFRQAKMVLGYI